MTFKEIISGLDKLGRSGSEYRRTVCRLAAETMEVMEDKLHEASALLKTQQVRIAELEAELKEERYRHDRLQDFKVAEAQISAKLREEQDDAIRELRHLSVCSTCSKNGVECHVGMPVAENDVCCGGYRWRGAKDMNVPGKPVTDTNVGVKEAT